MPGSNPTNNNGSAVTVSRTVIINDSTVPVSSQTPVAPQQAGPMCVQPQTQYFPANPAAVAQTYQTPAQPGTLGYFMQTMPETVSAMDAVSAAIDMQTRLSGEGWTRPAAPSDIVSAEISRLRQQAELYDGIPGKERLVETTLYEAGLLDHLSSNGGVPGAMIDIQLAGREVYLVGDLHGNTAGLELILNKADAGGVTILQKIQAGKAVVVFEGDAIHPPLAPYDAMDPSIEVLDKIAGLKAQYPDNVFYTRGNHDYVYGSGESLFNKGYVRQGVVFRDVLIRQRTTAYARSAEAFFARAPLTIRVIEGSEVVAAAGHTPVAVNGLTPEQAVAASFDPAIRTEITWNEPGHGLTAYQRSYRGKGYTYSNAEIVRMRATFGTERTVIVSAHTPYDTSAYLPPDMPGHVILQATSDFNSNLSIVKVSPDSSVTIYDVTGTSAMAGVDLRPQIPQTAAVPVAAQPAVAPIAQAASATAAGSTPSIRVEYEGVAFDLNAGVDYRIPITDSGLGLSDTTGSVATLAKNGLMKMRVGKTFNMGPFELTRIGAAELQVRYVPGQSSPVAHYSGVLVSDILVFDEPLVEPTGTFEEGRTQTAERTTAASSAEPSVAIQTAQAVGIGGLYGGMLCSLNGVIEEHVDPAYAPYVATVADTGAVSLLQTWYNVAGGMSLTQSNVMIAEGGPAVAAAANVVGRANHTLLDAAGVDTTSTVGKMTEAVTTGAGTGAAAAWMWPYLSAAGPWGFVIGTGLYILSDWQNTSPWIMAAGNAYSDAVHTVTAVPETDVPVLHEIAEAADRNLQVVANVVSLDVAQGFWAAINGEETCAPWDDCFYE